MWMIINQNQDDYLDTFSVPTESWGFAISQGLTAERVLIHADTGVRGPTQSRFGYLAISRASDKTSSPTM
jgi:hypothetical protein